MTDPNIRNRKGRSVVTLALKRKLWDTLYTILANTPCQQINWDFTFFHANCLQRRRFLPDYWASLRRVRDYYHARQDRISAYYRRRSISAMAIEYGAQPEPQNEDFFHETKKISETESVPLYSIEGDYIRKKRAKKTYRAKLLFMFYLHKVCFRSVFGCRPTCWLVFLQRIIQQTLHFKPRLDPSLIFDRNCITYLLDAAPIRLQQKEDQLSQQARQREEQDQLQRQQQ